MRDVHINNDEHRRKFFATCPTSYESTMNLLNYWSYRFYDKYMVVSQAIKAEDAALGNV